MLRVAVDARMIGHSGIGVSLRGLLHAWAVESPGFGVRLLGDPALLEALAPRGLDAEFDRHDAPIYGVRTLLARPRARGCRAYFTPHYPAPLAPGLPLVAMVHDLLHVTHPPRRGTPAYQRLCLRALARWANFAVTVSRIVKVQLQTLHAFAAQRVLTIPHGPGLAGLATPVEPRPEFGLRRDGYLMAVGIWKPHKNWDFLLGRMAANGVRLPLVAAGLGEGVESLRECARAHDVADRVIALPHLSDGELLGVLRGARALLFPSLAEGFGLPIVEAMSLGVPVVAADRSPMCEIGGGAIASFDPDHAETFDAAVAAVLDTSRRAAFIAAGIAQAATFSWAKAGRQMADAIHRAIAEGAR